jgi:hypothetical protein
MAMNTPGGPPGPRGYWGYWDRPYTGCGCIWAIFVIIIIWWIIAAFAYEPARFGWW